MTIEEAIILRKPQRNEWRNVLLCCMIWAMFGVINLTIAYNQPDLSVYWDNKRLDLSVAPDLKVDIASFCQQLALEYTIDGQQLVIGKESPTIIRFDEIFGYGTSELSHGDKVPVEGLCQALGIAYQLDKQTKIIKLGDTAAHATEIPVLMYHHILPQKDIQGVYYNNNLVVSAENFQAQMTYLKDNGYQTVSLSKLECYIAGEELLPEKSVVITFDDGYLSNYHYAYPILKKNGFTGTIFLLTSYIEEKKQSFDAKRLQYLSWEDIDQMRDVFTFASHTDNMHKLNVSGKSILSQASYDRIVSDLSTSRRLLNHTPYFSYPYGHFSETAKEALRRHGVKLAFIATDGSVKIGDDPLTLKRWDVYRYQALEKFKNIVN